MQIKTFAWESAFVKKISEVRSEELKTLLSFLKWIAIGFQLVLGTTITLMLLVVFVVFVSTGGVLTPAVAFTTWQLFQVIQTPFVSLPGLLVGYLQAQVALNRVRKFLLAPEMKGYPAGARASASERPKGAPMLSISNSKFEWPKPPPPTEKELAAKKRMEEIQQARAAKAAKKAAKKGGKTAGTQDAAAGAGDAAAEGAAGSDGAGADSKKEEKKEEEKKEDEEPFELTVDEFVVRPGELVAVVGNVGSGKSALLAALMGELDADGECEMKVHGKVAYVAQNAWILNQTVRDNITFSKEFDRRRYNKVLDACALRTDLEVLPGGDKCEIGERGVNLSGGQKQRVSLARAVYADADVILADDPLSAVDAHVGEHLFRECFCGYLKDKTRVLVTNQLQYLPAVDRIVVMDKGAIVETGSHAELVAAGGVYKHLLDTLGMSSADGETKEDGAADATAKKLREQSVERRRSDAARRRAETRTRSLSRARRGSTESRERSRTASEAGAAEEGRLVEDEERDVGLVGGSVYAYYLRNIGCLMAFVTVFFVVGNQGCAALLTFWLGEWSAAGNGGLMSDEDLSFYLTGFGLISLALVVALFMQSIVAAYATHRASESLHKQLLTSVVRSPMSFYDTTPAGRIINRFSKDMETVDSVVGRLLGFALTSVLGLIMALASISIATKGVFLIVVPFVGVIYFKIQLFLRRSAVEIQRLESTTKSPIFASFGESLHGLDTIRAYGLTEHFCGVTDELLDANNVPTFTLRLMQMWLSMRLETLGALIAFGVAALAVAVPDFVPIQFVAVGLSYAVQTTRAMEGVVQAVAIAEAQMSCVQRVQEYAERLEAEAPFELPDKQPAKEWPSKGEVAFLEYSLRYRPDKPLVLKSVTCEIGANQKVGVVGRTGAGKSSLMVGLFRIVESAGGKIVIDGIDISTIGLKDLRNAIGMIPQDPVLFTGTLRYNLDPFSDYSDDKLWEALKSAQLQDSFKSLDATIAEGGSNQSVGERQLICMARALLRNPKILVMDEATANIDTNTDAKIQQMIREAFADSTVLTIAHRLETIMDSDMILVLDSGKVAEFDAPRVLVDKEGGLLKSMVDVTGKRSAKHLRKIAYGELSVGEFISDETLTAEAAVEGELDATPYLQALDDILVKLTSGPVGLVLARPADGFGAVVAAVGADAAEAVAAATKSGDVLLAIDGVPVDSMAYEAVVDLMEETNAKLTDGAGEHAIELGRPVPSTSPATGAAGGASGSGGAASSSTAVDPTDVTASVVDEGEAE